MRLSLEVKHAQEQVYHLVALQINVEKFKVDLTIKSMAVSHVGHGDHVVFFAGDGDFAGASIDLLDIELFAFVQSDVGENFHNLLGDHVSCTKRRGM